MFRKFISSSRYFIFLAFNWNLKIAWLLVRNDIKGDKKYGIETTGYDNLKHLKKIDVDITHSTIYMPAPYQMLKLFFEKSKLNQRKHFLDIGCGKGRALIVAAATGVERITGVELSARLLAIAKKNIITYSKKNPSKKIELKHDDAWYFDIEPDVDIIFLFNPFDELLMQQVADNINKSFFKNPRHIQIIYFNPLHKHVFLNLGYHQTFHWQKMVYFEGVILEKG